MNTDKKEKLFKLENDNWIYISEITGLIFREKMELNFSNTIIPPRVCIERINKPSVDVAFKDEQKAKDYMSLLAKKVNDLNSEEK